MTAEQKLEILSDAEVMQLREQLKTEGAPVDLIMNQAFQEVTKNMSPGTEIAARLVADCLLQKLKEWQEKKHPTTFWGKLVKLFATGKWG